MTDEERISELIILDAAGIISKEDSAELLKFMNQREDFPWDELGEYQNLCALLSLTVELKTPSANVKTNILKIVKKISERKNMTQDRSSVQIKAEDNFDSFELVSTTEKRLKKESISIKDPDLSGLNAIRQEGDFEEVKSRVALIKEKQDHKKPVERPSTIREFRAEDFFKEKEKKNKKPRNKNVFLLLIVFLITVVGIGFIFIVNSNESKNENNKAVDSHNEEMISKSIPPEELLPTEQTAETIEFTEPESPIVAEQVIREEEKPVINKTQSKEIEQPNLINNQRVELPELKPPAIIEAPLSEPPSEVKNKPVTETNLSVNNQIPPVEKIIVEEEKGYFVAVEEMPEPIGGVASILEKIVYPELARRSGVEGKVYVRAFVDESGTVTKAEVIKGIGMGCDEAALNAVLSTKFKPGSQRGKPVKVQITVPITFKHN